MAFTNGHQKIDYDPHFTDAVIAATGPKTNPRLKEAITALIRHVHDFAREVNLSKSFACNPFRKHYGYGNYDKIFKTCLDYILTMG